jgi:hypothetical protein
LNEIGIQKARSALCFRIKSGKERGVTNEKSFSDCNVDHCNRIGWVATGKLKEKVSEEGPMWVFLFVQFLLARILIFTNYCKGVYSTDIVKCLGDFFLYPLRADFDTGMKITTDKQ